MRTHRLQQWPSRFCCDLFVPFALSGHFRSELRLLYPETLKHTHQGIVRNGKQFKTHTSLFSATSLPADAARERHVVEDPPSRYQSLKRTHRGATKFENTNYGTPVVLPRK
ncbi:hypothetical protein PIB30_023617 [Stylosanthes scabra]|uniref:Secreted protein n=1 Tax=Stylosanthes scabra TaxID=79078 RepID=A0ABU6Z648_9FABA|nr:hypothetical protein [Stylosanthes scabra]